MTEGSILELDDMFVIDVTIGDSVGWWEASKPSSRLGCASLPYQEYLLPKFPRLEIRSLEMSVLSLLPY